MVSQNDFLSCLFDINPDGDPTMAFESLNIVLGNNETTITGTAVTFELICNAYKSYCDLWDAKWEGTEAKFIPQKESKKNPWQFLNLSMYRQKFENTKTGRDDYLFGELKVADLNEQLKSFLHDIRKKNPF